MSQMTNIQNQDSNIFLPHFFSFCEACSRHRLLKARNFEKYKFML